MWRGADEIAGDRTIAARAREKSLLVIDDLGGEGGAFEGQSAIRGVISRRYDSKLPTVITTGLTMPDIRNRYGRYVAERLIEDIRHGGKIAECGDVSIRAS
jgi:DNA replication protein DnaC